MRLGPYEITAQIGAGGMGEVWRAVDERLGREVAVKVLPDRLASDPAAVVRFEREARAVAALSHPNILALYDVGRTEGVFYVVTELLRGVSLRTRLAHGPLPARIAVEYGLQIAQGLAAAHDRGLVHRDIKPENVFVTHDGHVKILDFGLARLAIDPAGWEAHNPAATTVAASPTIPGTLLGTPGYMSPEQVLGQPADHRSDIFSLGAVLSEMLTGRRAFGGSSVAQMQRAVLDQGPVLPERQFGAALVAVIRKCLRQEPEQRFPSARAIVETLQTVFAGVPVSEESSSIAVLPFVDMSQKRDQDYFCDGMAEEILLALSAIDGLRVAARTSTFQFRGATQDVRRIGQALGVSNVLEGSVRTSGKHLRVTAQLVHVASGYRVWSQRYDRDMEDIFAIQDEIAHSVVQALAIQFGAVESGTARKHTDNVTAYHLYMKGRHERYTTRNFTAALRYFQEATELDPRYALARVGIAEASILLANTGFVRPRVALAHADTELGYAMALAGKSAEMLSIDCFVRAYEWDWARAEEAGRQAIELDSNYLFARSWLSMILSATGRCEDAVTIARSVIPMDPLSAFGWAMTGWAFNAGRRFTDAETALQRALEIDSHFSLALWQLGISLVGLGRRVEALAMFERANHAERRSTLTAGMVAWAKALSGMPDEARSDLADLHETAKYRHVPRYPLAWTLAALGDIESALDQYEVSVGDREPFLMFPLFPGNDPLRGEPRFAAALHRMGLGWAARP
jgi:serine/threonine protein kinase/tetratricopeptide (TPR) repeat protein